MKDASRKHMSTEIGGEVISNLECVETMIQDTMQHLTDAYRVINTQTNTLVTSQSGHRSWAQTASWSDTPSNGSGLSTPPAAVPKAEPIRATDIRKEKGITVRIEDKDEREKISGLTEEQLVNAFRDERNAFTHQILAVRRLNGGDLLLQMVSVRAREELERKDE